jgi:hypothetical protein
MLPYLLSIVALVLVARKAAYPQALMKPYKRVLHHPALWALAVASFVAIFALRMPFPAIVAAAALCGAAIGRWAPQWLVVGGATQGAATGAGSAFIDDDTPTPRACAVFSRARPGAGAGWRGGCCGVAGMALLVAARGLVAACWPRWAGSSPRPRC